MNLQVFEGFLGVGKTTGMSVLALSYQQKSGCTLYSNYGLKGSKPFNKLSDFLDVAIQPSSIVCLDEAHVDLDARSFSTNSVKWFTQLIFYLRKMRCTLMMTSPLFANLDSRVRGITNIYTSIKKDKDYFYYNFYDIQSLRFLKSMKIKKEIVFSLEIFETNAIVSPLEYPVDKKDFDSLLRDLKQATLQYYLSA